MEKTKAIILITCDELTREALSCYGNRAVETKNLDRLCRESTEFLNMYTTSPWCLPARCSMLTGLYPHQNRAYSNFRPCPLDPAMPNLFGLLKKENYHISMFGKCHFAPVPYKDTRADQTLSYEAFRSYYKSLGIDTLVLEDGKQVSVWFYDDYARKLEKEGKLAVYRKKIWNQDNGKVFAFPGEAASHPDAWVGARAADYIKSNTEPYLFAWVSFSGPHYPFDPPEEYLKCVDRAATGERRQKKDEFLNEDRIHHDSYYGEGGIDGCAAAPGHACKNYTEEYWENMRCAYLANVKLIDDAVGRILEETEKKYGQDALILFTADHGEMFGNHGLWGKNNCFYEDVWHIPLFVKFPGQKEGTVRTELVNTTDLLPTCLEAAGRKCATGSGQSLYRTVDRDVTFAEGEGYIAATDGTCKFVHVQKEGCSCREFIDLETDPDEFVNKIHEKETMKKQTRLQEHMIRHLMPEVLP